MFELLVGERGFLREDGVVHVLYALAVERGRAGQQHVAEHAETPEIAAEVVVAVEHFGRRVVAGADLLRELFVAREVFREAEVDEDERRVRVVVFEEEVLEFEVAVHDAAFVKVVHGREHVAHEFRGAVLAEDEALVLAGVQQLEEFTA